MAPRAPATVGSHRQSTSRHPDVRLRYGHRQPAQGNNRAVCDPLGGSVAFRQGKDSSCPLHPCRSQLASLASCMLRRCKRGDASRNGGLLQKQRVQANASASTSKSESPRPSGRADRSSTWTRSSRSRWASTAASISRSRSPHSRWPHTCLAPSRTAAGDRAGKRRRPRGERGLIDDPQAFSTRSARSVIQRLGSPLASMSTM